MYLESLNDYRVTIWDMLSSKKSKAAKTRFLNAEAESLADMLETIRPQIERNFIGYYLGEKYGHSDMARIKSYLKAIYEIKNTMQ